MTSPTSTLNEINSIFKELRQNITILNKTNSEIVDKQKRNSITVPKKDKKKIVKLFQHSNWQQFMKWVNDKLVESGENQTISTQNTEQKQVEFDEKTEKNLQLKAHLDETLNFELTQEFKYSDDHSQSISSAKNKQNQTQNTITGLSKKQQEQLQLLALQNGRLRRQNIILKNKLIQIRTSLPQ